MNPALTHVIAAFAGAVLAVLIAWLLLRGRAVFEQETQAALGEQKAQLNSFASQFAGISQQLNGLALATPAELARLRENLLSALAQQRQDLGGSLTLSQQAVAQQTGTIALSLNAAFEAFAQQLASLATQAEQRGETLRASLSQNLVALNADARAGREEGALGLQRFREGMAAELRQLAEANSQRLQELRATVEARLKDLQADNSLKLEAMRQTVDEKLHATLETRLGESFKLVSERLEQVHRGLGEMQTIATGVGDLKRVLTNVKTRGGWGEIQLGNLLEQVLTAEQFARNVATRPGSNDRVEFAIRLPGRADDRDMPVWLPIDAKFPREDYERLMDAQDRADAAGVEEAARALEQRVKNEAKTIRDKYIAPPFTTDFGLLYLPTEGLYAEVLRRPGLADTLQRDYRVTVTGPTTITALLNSLQMGFRTLAIEQRSSEVWQVLGAVKTEFGKFGEVLDKVKKKLDEASSEIEKTGTRTRVIQKKLRSVESLPEPEAARLLPAALPEDEDSPAAV